MTEKKVFFSSRLGFILTSLGMAFGAGNIWRFPREVATYGGGAFLIAFIIATLVWAVPLLMIEMVMGKKTRLGTNGAFKNFVGKKYTWMGIWTGIVAVLIMVYYSVVTGWAIRYFVVGVGGEIKPGVDSDVLWKSFLDTPWALLFHVIAALIAGFIIIRGVQKGLELANKIIVPSIVIILAGVMIWSLTKPGAMAGMNYMFNPNFSGLLRADVWLAAFTQAAWSVGAGWGLMITYSSYMGDDDDIGANAFIIALADSGSSLLAGMAVIPLVFAMSPSIEAANQALTGSTNTGLTFVYMTKLFPNLPGGSILASIFFFALAISALASLLSMLELLVKNFVDVGISRKKAGIITTIVIIIFGAPSALKNAFFENQDFVWGVGLLFSGVFIAFAAYSMGVENMRQMIEKESWIKIGKWFNICTYALPVIFVAVLAWWVWQSITWYPKTWMNPLEMYSPMTMLLQWAFLIVLSLALNNYVADKITLPSTLPHIKEAK